MPLFGKKKEADKPEQEGQSVAKIEKKSVHKASPTDHNLTSVIVRPHVTEKSVGNSDQNVYTFEVNRSANKFDVRDAVKALYKVTPVKINIVNKKPAKRIVGSRGTAKHVKGVKKAYVYLKKGDTINLV